MSTIALITGANQGIGLATATSLAKDHGYHVIIGSRNSAAGEKAAKSIEAAGGKASSVQLDLTSDDSITAAAKLIDTRFGHLDVLVNNAAVLLDVKHPELPLRDMLTQTLQTNVVGTACVTEAMLPLLRKSALPRIVFLSSQMGSLGLATDRNTMWYAMDYKTYDASKAAMNMLALNYSRILEGTGAKVNVACPGLIATNLTGYHKYGGQPEDGAKRIVELATLGKDGPTETFSNSEGSIPW